MTQREWAVTATERLMAVGCEDAVFDVRCLLETFGGLPHGHLPDDLPIDNDGLSALNQALEQRLSGRPLQYIVGQWDFLMLSLAVGEGVLVPRADTECLCEETVERLCDSPRPQVLDLCAGSGCVGLGIASLHPHAQVTAVELSDDALPYLIKNTARYASLAVTVKKANVLTDAALFADGWDAIVSNPPYIPTADLDALQREVQCEPRMALDGDTDGLRFYRAIADDWIPKLRVGGVCAVEVGIGQAASVAALFEAAGLTAIRCVRDYGGVERVVSGIKK